MHIYIHVYENTERTNHLAPRIPINKTGIKTSFIDGIGISIYAHTTHTM